MILLLTLFVTYIPVYRLVNNLRGINDITKVDLRKEKGNGSKFIYNLTQTDASMLALMISITILLLVPNGIDVWEHFVVLFIALIVLIIYNTVSVNRRTEAASVEVDDGQYEVSLDEFKDIMSKMVEEKSNSLESPVISIDTRDYKN